jgi:hypothetical protein
MPTKLCAYGFSCASMLMQPGLIASECPNQKICGTIIRLTDLERLELSQGRWENARHIIETVEMTRAEAADYLLASRGTPQSPESLGVLATIEGLRSTISQLEATITELSAGYIAPVGIEAHRYLVKRRYGIYQYNKLAAKRAIFLPQIKEDLVTVIHLSKDDDPRNLKGRAGIERRNRLLAISTAVQAATNLLRKAIEANSTISTALVTRLSIEEVVAARIERERLSGDDELAGDSSLDSSS